jgi:hypothetical protein
VRPLGTSRLLGATAVKASVLALLALLPLLSHAQSDSSSRIPDDATLEAAGAVVGTILIDTRNVFSAAEADGRPIRLLADRAHTRTRESVIREALLFKEGDRYSHRQVAESARLLRKKPYLFDAAIIKVAYHDGRVDLKVTTKDVWAVFPSFSFARSGGSNSSGAGIQDINVLGSGMAVGISRSRTIDRTQSRLSVSDSDWGSNHLRVNAAYSDNSDGSARSFDLERPFYALDTHWATGASASDYRQIDSLYDQGAIIDQFQAHEQTAQAYAGWSPGLQNGWVERFTIGVTHDDIQFEAIPSAIGPSLLPADRKLDYPWVQVELLQDSYVTLLNHDQIGRTEDLHLGARLLAQVGFAEPAFGSDRHAVMVTSSASYGAQPIPIETVLLSTSFSGRIESGTLRDGKWNAHVRWYLEEANHWLSYATIDETVGHNLDLDDQILLGGDSGLRGYPLRYQDGTARVLATVEQRYFSDLYLFGTQRLGGALFVDSGRVWGAPPLATPNLGFLSDVGFGLRIGNSPFGNITHIDLAFPLNGPPSIARTQLLVQIQAQF